MCSRHPVSRRKYNCQLTRLDFQQEEGLMSCLPLGVNQVEIQRGLTTSSTAIFVPFTTQELFQNGREALYYGINALSSNLIMVDRKLLKNPNGLILGTPGSGKRFFGKTRDCQLFPADHRRHYHLRPGGRVRAAGRASARTGHQNLAHFYQLHQPDGPEPGLFGR